MGNLKPHYTHVVKRHTDGYAVGERSDRLTETEFKKLQNLMEGTKPGHYKWIIFRDYSK